MKIAYSSRLKQKLKEKQAELDLENPLKQEELVDKLLQEVVDKKNRYLFYCPDVPFPIRTVITIYQISNMLNQMGYDTYILHEQHGFRPNWMLPEYLDAAKIKFLHEKNSNPKTDIPSFRFKQNDSIIIPDGFWQVMENLVELKINKIVFCMSYDGLAAAEIGINWSHLGFNTVLCVSDSLLEDYRSCWPELNYVKLPFYIEEYKTLDPLTIKPTIGLFIRSRKQAKALINVFYAKYPFLNLFQFKILRNLTQTQYIQSLQESAVVVIIDQNTGCNVPVIEAIAAGKPVIAVVNRGFNHVPQLPNIIGTEVDDLFEVAEILGEFCNRWLVNPTEDFGFPVDQKLVNQFSEANTRAITEIVFGNLQNEVQTRFETIQKILNDQHK